MSEYTSRATIGCPESLITPANHLACYLGESAADIGTFRAANYQDASGNLYAICSTVVKPIFLESATGVLPEMPDHAVDLVDPALAQQVLDTLGQPGGLMMVVGDDAQAALKQMGLTQLRSNNET